MKLGQTLLFDLAFFKSQRRSDKMEYPTPIAKLIESYMRLPGIGAKTAARLAFLH